ncbi:SIMPL domain-containing protein [Flavobacterium sp.]|uniref:SIMPL domain-containing protein n=1 Tax=Flavobacterium sp. TaxID=239 RepID=UPI00286C0C03|nr:SIMPL domain-containing protein [Flavobacterium sp.]
MKKSALILFVLFATMVQSQEIKQIPTINVSGEGKIKVTPDQAAISISVETKGAKAIDVKKENDTKIDAVLKYIKKMAIAKEDYQTQRVSLYPNYDYEKKKTSYIATQTVIVLLKDLNKYDALMDGLVDLGINRIDNVEFKSSKIDQLQSDARKLAIKDAKAKAEDFVSVLNQKVGKALTISDNSQVNYPPRPMYEMKTMAMADGGGAAPRETLATGEIELVVNVSVSFVLE